MQILPTGRPMMSVSGVSKRAYSTTPSLTVWLPLFPAKSATTAAVARGFNVETITPEGARHRNSLLVAAAALPVTTVPRTAYASSLGEARKRIARRDPDDVELLALAIQLKLPVWSNDNDFEDTGVVWHTTASLLAALDSK